MLVTTTAKLNYVTDPPQLTATVTLPSGKTAKVGLRNPKWEKSFELETLDGKTYKLQGEVTLNPKSSDSPGTEGVFTILRMKRAAFTPR